MELHEIIVKNYDLELIEKIGKTENGSGYTYLIESVQRKYIAKVNERVDFVNIYEKVQQILNAKNLKQSKIIRTNEGAVITPEQVVIYEFIEGSIYRSLNKCQSENVIKYMKKYNEALRSVPLNETDITMLNHWDKAKSLDFMINEFAGYLQDLDINTDNKENIYKAISILAENKAKLSVLSKQLIHSDLGSDNFIFIGDEIISVIDFAPEYNHELYALCQFIYWNYLWDNQNKNLDEMNTFLRLYNNDRNIGTGVKTFHLLLVEAILFRIIGPVLDMLTNNIKDYGRLDKRFDILRDMIALLS